MTDPRPLLLGLNGAAVGCLAGLLVSWARHERRWRLVCSGCSAVAVAGGVYFLLVRPSDIPTDWITVLHEGYGYQDILHLYARGAHAGVNFRSITDAVSQGTVPALRAVVWLNLLLALVNAIVFFHIALRLTGVIWSVVWTAVFALNPATFQASFSELPTNVLALYFLAGVVAWAVLTDSRPQPRPIRLAAYLLCGLLTLLVALTRTEVALIGVTALAVYIAPAVIGVEAWARMGARLIRLGERSLEFLSAHPWTVVLVGIVGVWLSKNGLPWGLVGRGVCAGLNPFDPSIASLYLYLPMLLLPIGASVAILFGSIRALLSFRMFGGLALSLVMLVRTYFAAQNQYYEAGRYLSYILPAVFLLGLFGQRQLEQFASAWGTNGFRVARVAYLLLWFTRPLPGVPDRFLRLEYRREDGISQLFLNLNRQREVRHLVATVEKSPQCVFISRVLEAHDDPQRNPTYDYAIFGAPVSAPVFVPEDQASLDQVVARYAPDAACVRLYYGADCNLTFTDRCAAFVAQRRLIAEERFWSRPYDSPLEFGHAEPEVVLATYAWP